MKSKNFIIKVPIYKRDLMISVGESDERFKKQIQNNVFPEDFLNIVPEHLTMQSTNLAKTVFLPSSGQVFIRLRKTPKTFGELGTLAHELFHAADFIMNAAGMSLVSESCEAYAYLIGYLTEEVYRNL